MPAAPPSLPIASELREPPSAPALVRAPPEDSLLVLVVEDDEDMRFLYMGALAGMGYRTAGETDGARGVEAALRLLPDAILMDVSMPVLGGIEATRRLKEDPRTSGCLVILMTGHGMKKFEEARAAGCDAFFCKPFDPDALHEVIRTLASPAEQAKLHVRAEMVKRCVCGRQFALKDWLALPSTGRMHVPQRGVVIELRTCTCGSSLSVELDDLGNAAVRTAPVDVPHDGAGGGVSRNTVLVADRDPHVRRLVERFLGDAYAVEFADDGYSALDRVRASAPSAVITEILIPRLDGLALCRSLKGDPVTQRVPILVISMLAANERARQSGADAFLQKPFEKTSLVASVRGLIEPKEREGAVSPQDRSTS
jgi:two-component system cell cycle response regulator DivK